MATNSEVKILGMEGTEQLVATVKKLLADQGTSVEEQIAKALSQKSQIQIIKWGADD